MFGKKKPRSFTLDNGSGERATVVAYIRNTVTGETAAINGTMTRFNSASLSNAVQSRTLHDTGTMWIVDEYELDGERRSMRVSY